MKKLFKHLFYSKSFERAMLSMALSTPRLTAGEYARLSKALRELDNDIQETQVKLKKAA